MAIFWKLILVYPKMWSKCHFFPFYGCQWSPTKQEKDFQMIGTALWNFKFFGSPCNKIKKKSLSQVKMYKIKVVGYCPSHCSKFSLFWRISKIKSLEPKNVIFWNFFKSIKMEGFLAIATLFLRLHQNKKMEQWLE